MTKEQGKSYLLETITSIFHESIIPEVKLNLEDLHRYFDKQGETYRVLLDVIENYDSNSITKLIIQDSLTRFANRTEEESKNIISRIVEARKMIPDEVDNIKKRLKDICQQSYIEYARQQAGDDLDKYLALISTYKYKDLGSSDYIVKDIADLDTTTLTEQFLNNPIESHYDFINNCFAGRSGYLRGSIGIVCARPKAGKSMFLMTEAVNFAMQGYKVHYLALGDLNELDFLARMSAIHTQTSFEVVYSDVETYKKRLVEHVRRAGGKITITCKPSAKLPPSEFYNVAVNRLKDYDVLIIDYDLNFLMTSDDMYTRGGELYDLLSQIKTENNCLILVATQPNKAYWSEDFLDDTCFIESSKKSMIVDFAITIGKAAGSGTHCGYINMAINRRGSNPFRPYIFSDCGEIVTVPESVYSQYNNNQTKRIFTMKELNILQNMKDPDRDSDDD
jgi:archaellum biogenesis ATPase FlaH